MKRILSILAFFLLSVVVTLAGVLTPLSAQEVETKNNDLTQIQTEVQSMGFGQGVIAIFSNNIVIGLLSFVPIAGPVLGSYILYNTGTYVAAQSITEGWPPALVFLLMFIYPHVWLEFFAYSIGFAESIWLIRRITQHKIIEELRRTGIYIAISAGLLVLGAVVEMAIIATFS